MPETNAAPARSILRNIAYRVMLARGLDPEFSRAALAELAAINQPAIESSGSARDLRDLLWCSIDNDDSRDLDQLTFAETLPDGSVRAIVAVADVAAVVRRGSAIDGHAGKNTTSVYTAAEIFPMLPEKLSTDLTSLGFEAERLAITIDMIFARSGSLEKSDIYEAKVKNKAKLAYNSVAAWLEGTGPMPPAIGAVPGLEDTIRLQHRLTQQMRAIRHKRGALSFETIRARPVFAGDALRDLEVDAPNQAKQLIEELMIAANGVTARYLAAKKRPSIRRVVRTPKHWDEIVDLAAALGSTLPKEPDSAELEQFLVLQKAADPLHFPDLSLSVIKLMGAGEYVVNIPGQAALGHFGLAVKDYEHSTAPNRRFPDLITQRLLKSALAGLPSPYSNAELDALAQHCTEQEDAAKKVERQVAKSAAAILLRSRIGEQFDAIVTGVTDSGVWARLFHPPVEGKVVGGFERLRVGDRVRIKLLHADVERGFLDFASMR